MQVFVRSGGKASEPHAFYYTPPAMDGGPLHATRHLAQGNYAAQHARFYRKLAICWGAMGTTFLTPFISIVTDPGLRVLSLLMASTAHLSIELIYILPILSI